MSAPPFLKPLSNGSGAAAAAGSGSGGHAPHPVIPTTAVPLSLVCAKCGRTGTASTGTTLNVPNPTPASPSDAKAGDKTKTPNGGTGVSSLKRCFACRKVWYCSADCQRADWQRHKPACVAEVNALNAKRLARSTAHQLANAAATAGGTLYLWGTGENGLLAGAAPAGPALGTTNGSATSGAIGSLKAAVAAAAAANAGNDTTVAPMTDDAPQAAPPSELPPVILLRSPSTPSTGTAAPAGAAAAAAAAADATDGKTDSTDSKALTTTTATATATTTTVALAPGEFANAPVPTPVPALLSIAVTRVSLGVSHALAITVEGQVLSWGDNAYGQLGQGDRRPRPRPAAINALDMKVMVDIAVGQSHSVGVTRDGEWISWGNNEFGQLGIATAQGVAGSAASGRNADGTFDFADKLSPAVVKQLRGTGVRLIGVACGDRHTLALDELGRVFAAGDASKGALGFGPRITKRVPVPALIDAIARVPMTRIACGAQHSLALSATGSLYAWGDARRGQTGHPASAFSVSAPPKLVSNQSGGHNSAGARAARGDMSVSAKAVADAQSNSTPKVDVPKRVDWFHARHLTVVALSCASAYSACVTSDGALYVFGHNDSGQMGLGSAHPVGETYFNPVRVPPPLRDVVQVQCGLTHVLAVTHDQSLWAAGANDCGQLGVPTLQAVVATPSTPTVKAAAGAAAAATAAATVDIANRWAFALVTLQPPPHPPVNPFQHATPATTPRTPASPLPAAGTKPSLYVLGAGAAVSGVVVGRWPASAYTSFVGAATAGTPMSYHTTTTASKTNSPAPSPPFRPQIAVAAAVTPLLSLSAADTKHDNNIGPTPMVVAATPTKRAALRPLPASARAPLALQRPVLATAFDFDAMAARMRLASVTMDWSGVVKHIGQVFSSASLLNASFLPPHGSNGVSAYTVERFYRLVLRMSAQHPDVAGALINAIQKLVLDTLTHLRTQQPSPDETAYRFFAIVLACPLLSRGTQRERLLLSDLCQAIRRIPPAARQFLVRTFADYPPELFGSRLVKLVTSTISQSLAGAFAANVNRWRTALSERQIAIMQNPLLAATESNIPPEPPKVADLSDDVVAAFELLDLLHTANTGGVAPPPTAAAAAGKGSGAAAAAAAAAGSVIARSRPARKLVADSQFYIPTLHEHVNLLADLQRWLTPVPFGSAQLPDFAIARYPFVLSPLTKSHYLKTESLVVQQHHALRSVQQAAVPFLLLKVRRQALVDDVLFQLGSASAAELRRPLKVEFLDEAGVDAGGLTTEFFTLISHELVQRYNLFEYSPELRTLWYSASAAASTKERLQLMRMFGVIVGLSVYHNVAIGLNFPQVFFRKLLGDVPTLDDLVLFDPILGKSLQQLLDFDGDVENTFALTFEITEAVAVPPPTTTPTPAPVAAAGAAVAASAADAKAPAAPAAPAPAAAPTVKYVTRELMPGGSKVAVTAENRQKYVELYIDHRLHGGVKAQSDAFLSGFRTACDGASLKLFTAPELELLICGVVPLGAWRELEASVAYEGGYTKDSPAVRHFWSVVHNDLTPDQRLALLAFVTGSSRMPLGGMAELRMVIQRSGPDGDTLPSSSTCFHVLLLPDYPTRDKTKQKLLLALQFGQEGFGLQ